MTPRIPQLAAWLGLLAFVGGVFGAWAAPEGWQQFGCGCLAWCGLAVTMAAIADGARVLPPNE
jgi:hypothetical protein